MSSSSSKFETRFVASLFTAIILGYPALCIYVKRLHDINFSGYWVIPIVVMGLFQQGLSIGYLSMEPAARAEMMSEYLLIQMALSLPVLTLILWPGSRSANKFGPPSRR